MDGRLQRVKVGDAFSGWQTVGRGVSQGSVLSPMFFNIILNDLFYHIKTVKIHASADDEQLYESDVDPEALDRRIQHEVQIANKWYTENGMIVNPDKHHAMVLGTTDHRFSFPVEESLDLLGMTIDTDDSLTCLTRVLTFSYYHWCHASTELCLFFCYDY